jgi:hypothetical protein
VDVAHKTRVNFVKLSAIGVKQSSSMFFDRISRFLNEIKLVNVWLIRSAAKPFNRMCFKLVNCANKVSELRDNAAPRCIISSEYNLNGFTRLSM